MLFSIIFFALFLISVIILLGKTLGMFEDELDPVVKKVLKVVALVCFILMLKPFQIISADERGLMFTLGKLQEKELTPGLTLKLPLVQTIKCVPMRPIEMNMAIEVGSGGAITKDNQTIGATLMFFYRYKEGNLVEMYSKYGENRLKSIVAATGSESFKSDIGNYDIFSLPTHQETIRKNTLIMIKDKLTGYPIEITELKITNYDWSDEFDKQISETMHRAQQVKQKEQELLITEQEAQKKVKQATADKQVMITQAEGEKESAKLMADAKALQGEGIRKYNEAVQRNMQLEVELRRLEIEKIKAERWNGQYVPTNNYGPIPVQMGSVQK
jgi:regulator of protease activity HflC (stomatin/prohibitin superfamily)